MYTDQLFAATECKLTCTSQGETFSEPSLYSLKCCDVSDIVVGEGADGRITFENWPNIMNKCTCKY